jgi:hypothetical protein
MKENIAAEVDSMEEGPKKDHVALFVLTESNSHTDNVEKQIQPELVNGIKIVDFIASAYSQVHSWGGSWCIVFLVVFTLLLISVRIFRSFVVSLSGSISCCFNSGAFWES